MKPYNSYSYIYPPRPEYKILPNSLDKYDTGEYIAQPKINGSNAIVFINENELKVCKSTWTNFNKRF